MKFQIQFKTKRCHVASGCAICLFYKDKRVLQEVLLFIRYHIPTSTIKAMEAVRAWAEKESIEDHIPMLEAHGFTTMSAIQKLRQEYVKEMLIYVNHFEGISKH